MWGDFSYFPLNFGEIHSRGFSMIFTRSLLALGLVTTLLAGCATYPIMQEDTVKALQCLFYEPAHNRQFVYD